MANILVTENFLEDTYRLIAFLDGRLDDSAMESVRKRIETEITEKLKAKKRRQSFTDYKTAAHGTDERDTARRKYLDDAGIHKDWRTASEKQPE